MIERYLEGYGIRYNDGFEPPVYKVRYWSPKVLADSSRNVRLLKLHGSVNWFLYESRDVGIAVDGHYSDTKDRNGQPQDLLYDRPMLLIGTLNKMLEYTSGIHAVLFF